MVRTFALLFFLAMSACAQDLRSAEIEAFNKRFDDAVRAMDNDNVLALWAEDGIDLMPGQQALVGKPAIKAWMIEVTSHIKGYKMREYQTSYHIISADDHTATEWVSAKQVLDPPNGGKPLEATGRLVLVLAHESGAWKIKAEMWQPAP